MLEKKKGVYNIDKLWAILLYEADFNQNNKKLGRDMLALVEEFNVIAPEQSVIMLVSTSVVPVVTVEMLTPCPCSPHPPPRPPH
jgi:hypothetical protein